MKSIDPGQKTLPEILAKIPKGRSIQKVDEIGGEMFWRSQVSGSLITPAGEAWDEAMLVKYPSIEAFIEKLAMPDYQKATVHRSAALADSKVIATLA
jgi:uncharacterized protein (DUF1330 family)